MAKRKAVSELSAQELYELAKKREQEEADQKREEAKQQIEELKQQRKELVSQHKKDLAAIDKEIRTLKRAAGAATRSTGRGGNISQAVIDIISASGQASTKEIKAGLEQAGVDSNNLGQCLAYLKRKGRIYSPERAVYALA